KGGSWENVNIVNQKVEYKTYNYASKVIDDVKAASNNEGEAFKHYLRPVDTDRADNVNI
ncbi:4684_t:CDS:1, partial [Racocetra persica]